MAACKNKPLVSREHSQGFCQNRLLYLLDRSSEVLVTLSLSYILWGRQYSNRLKRYFKSVVLSLTTTRIFKMEDDFSLPPARSFGSSCSGEGTHDEARRTSRGMLGCNFGPACQIVTNTGRPMYLHYGFLLWASITLN